MGSSPSKKVFKFTIKDAIPLRFNDGKFQATNQNGTIIKELDNSTNAGEDSTNQGTQMTQPQRAQSLPAHRGKTWNAVTKRTLSSASYFFSAVAA